MPRNSALRLLHGPPPTLPAWVDRGSERWWRLAPRTRALAIATLLLAGLAAGVGQAASSPWGPPVTVTVAARDLAVGEVLTAGDLRRTGWPRDLVPDGAVDAAPSGDTVVAPVAAGTVLTEHHLSVAGLGAMVAEDQAAVAVPIELVPAAMPAMRLDLVAVDLDGRGVRLAADATVLSIDPAHVWVAVQRTAAPDVAAAAGSGGLAVVIVPPG